MRFVAGFALSAAAVALPVLLAAPAANAATVIPFQLNTAPFGNPNGSFDAKAGRCAAIVGEKPGVVVITGAEAGRWGCHPSAPVQWINLSTGATGATVLSDGLHGFPPQVPLRTGPGQVALTLTVGGIVTPGFATFVVP